MNGAKMRRGRYQTTFPRLRAQRRAGFASVIVRYNRGARKENAMKRAFPFVMLLAAAVLGTAAAAQEAPPSKASNKAGSKPMSQKAAPGDKQAMIREALSAAPRTIAKTAKIGRAHV